jgi:hypothetical protein
MKKTDKRQLDTARHRSGVPPTWIKVETLELIHKDRRLMGLLPTWVTMRIVELLHRARLDGKKGVELIKLPEAITDVLSAAAELPANGPRRPSPQHQPPRNAEFLLYLIYPKEQCDPLVGDLEERYGLILQKLGERRARLWYWSQAIRSLAPLAFQAAKKLSGMGRLLDVFHKYLKP